MTAGTVQREQDTLMFREAAEAPHLIAMQLESNRALLARIGGQLRERAPRAVVTAARGSSDHVATFAKYLIETKTGTITASAAPSTSSVYAPRSKFEDVLFLAISQSGKSPDLIAATAEAKKAGAYTLVIVNDEKSPLAELADEVLPLCAGAERSVAATKTYLASAAAVVALVAAWCDDATLHRALSQLPDQLT
ncbi:MAG TPA: SIS domain-containing protein, partial [Rhizomicrobium sp.]